MADEQTAPTIESEISTLQADLQKVSEEIAAEQAQTTNKGLIQTSVESRLDSLEAAHEAHVAADADFKARLYKALGFK